MMFTAIWCMVMGMCLVTHGACLIWYKDQDSHRLSVAIGVSTFIVGLLTVLSILYPGWWLK